MATAGLQLAPARLPLPQGSQDHTLTRSHKLQDLQPHKEVRELVIA